MPQFVEMSAVSCAREASLIPVSRIPFLVMMEGSSKLAAMVREEHALMFVVFSHRMKPVDGWS